MTAEALRVLLADDHAVVRAGTRHILERDPSIAVVGEAADGIDAVRLAEELRPDVVLLDVALPLLNGIQATEQIRALVDPPYVILLSAYDDRDYVLAAMEAGASGYFLKTAGAEQLVGAIRSAVAGEFVLQPVIARLLVERGGSRLAALSDRELQVVRLAARGMANRDIGAALAVSARTVEADFTSVFSKLGVGNRTQAITAAAQRGWLEDMSV